jgi:hypothetical protein
MEDPKWETRTVRRRVAWALDLERGHPDLMGVSNLGLTMIQRKFVYRVLQDGRLV